MHWQLSLKFCQLFEHCGKYISSLDCLLQINNFSLPHGRLNKLYTVNVNSVITDSVPSRDHTGSHAVPHLAL